jgi:hypothetical protein
VPEIQLLGDSQKYERYTAEDKAQSTRKIIIWGTNCGAVTYSLSTVCAKFKTQGKRGHNNLVTGCGAGGTPEPNLTAGLDQNLLNVWEGTEMFTEPQKLLQPYIMDADFKRRLASR